MKSRKFLVVLAKLTLLASSLLVAAVIGEFGLRMLGYQAIYEVYSKPSVLWQYDELLGWSHEPNTEARYIGPRPWPVEFSSPVSINSAGLRGPELADLPPHGVRIMMLGDSMVAGFEVEREQTFAALTQDLLTEAVGVPVQVVNAGVRGYGTDQSLLYYTERGRKLEPDVVVLFLSVNDLVNDVTIHRMRRIFGKPAFVPDGPEGLRLVGRPVPDYPECSEYRVSAKHEIVRLDSPAARVICRLQMHLFDRSALFSYLTNLVPWEQWGDLLRNLYNAGMPASEGATEGTLNATDASGVPSAITDRIVASLAREVKADGARFFVMSTPKMLLRFEDAGVRIGELEVISLAEVEAAGPSEVSFKHDSHFNAKGHRMIAENLRDVLGPVVAEIQRAKDAGAQAP